MRLLCYASQAIPPHTHNLCIQVSSSWTLPETEADSEPQRGLLAVRGVPSLPLLDFSYNLGLVAIWTVVIVFKSEWSRSLPAYIIRSFNQ